MPRPTARRVALSVESLEGREVPALLSLAGLLSQPTISSDAVSARIAPQAPLPSPTPPRPASDGFRTGWGHSRSWTVGAGYGLALAPPTVVATPVAMQAIVQAQDDGNAMELLKGIDKVLDEFNRNLRTEFHSPNKLQALVEDLNKRMKPLQDELTKKWSQFLDHYLRDKPSADVERLVGEFGRLQARKERAEPLLADVTNKRNGQPQQLANTPNEVRGALAAGNRGLAVKRLQEMQDALEGSKLKFQQEQNPKLFDAAQIARAKELEDRADRALDLTQRLLDELKAPAAKK